jgi:hypothetical protein
MATVVLHRNLARTEIGSYLLIQKSRDNALLDFPFTESQADSSPDDLNRSSEDVAHAAFCLNERWGVGS